MDEVEQLRLEWLSGVTSPTPSTSLMTSAMRTAPQVIDVSRKGAGFHQRAPDDRDLTVDEADAAAELVTRLVGLSVINAHCTNTPRAAFEPVARVRLSHGEFDEVVDVGPLQASGRAWVRRDRDRVRDSDGACLEVDADTFRWLVPRATSLRPRHVLHRPDDRRATRVQVRCGLAQDFVEGESPRARERDHAQGLQLVAPAGYVTDASISDLADAVLRGRALAWVADNDDGSFGFAREACRVTVTAEGAQAPVTMWFGAATDAGVYAKTDAQTGVMLLPRRMRERAGQLFVSRKLFSVDADRITKIDVDVKGAAVPVDFAKAQGVVSELTADRVVALRRPITGRPGLAMRVHTHDSTSPKVLHCDRASPTQWHCAVDDVAATYAVAHARLGAMMPPSVTW